MTTFAEQYEIFKNNVNSAMREDLAEKLGVTVGAIEQLGVGFHFGEQAWIFAERDAKGDIIGLSKRRNENGFKYMAKKSKRGLIYAYNQDYSIGDKKYDAGKFHWVRIADAGITCPVCGKPDWCLVSSDDPKDPSAVLCSRIADKSAKEIPGSGHLHILDPERQSSGKSNTVLSKTQLPIIIVEGASDVLAAMSLGFTCIGRPSATGGMEILKDMPLAGREVWIIGDNDAGAGREGAQKTYLNIKKMTETIQCIFPPEGIKDLRQWVERGLTQALLFEHAGCHGDASIAVDPNVFPDDAAYTVASKFMQDEYMSDSGVPLLRSFGEGYLCWKGYEYKKIATNVLRGKLHNYLSDKEYVLETLKEIKQVKYKATRSKVSDLLDALNAYCPVTTPVPSWLDKEEHVSPDKLIRFRNGMLDVNEYVKGNIKFYDPDPRLFAYGVLPYNFDENAWSNLWEDTYNQWLNEDPDRIRSLSQWMGYNVVPDVSREKLMIYTGPTRSGKSTATDVLQAMLSEASSCSTSFQELAYPHGLHKLVGRLSAVLGDAKTPTRREADTALGIILRIVGRDMMSINPKNATLYDARMVSRFTISMNGLPEFSDHAQALVARSLIIEFPNSYEGREDFTLKNRLVKEAADGKVINFALWGLKDLIQNGRFAESESSGIITEQFREVVAPVLSFVKECCVVHRDQWISTYCIYEAWQHWCTISGSHMCNINTFGRRLRQVCPSIIDFRPTVDDRRQRAYKGVTLQPWVYEQYIGRPIR